MLALTSLAASPAYARRFAITRIRGEYIVCTYVGGACIGRNHYATREAAWLKISELRNGVSL